MRTLTVVKDQDGIVKIVIDFSNWESFVKLSGENMYSFKFGGKKNTRISTRKANALKKVMRMIMNKRITIKLKEDKVPSIIKENQEDRKERLRYASTMRTQVVPNKKKNSRAKQKQIDRREMDKHV